MQAPQGLAAQDAAGWADRAVELATPAIRHLFRTIQVCPKDWQATLR